MSLKVAIIGPESCGKTTLSQQLHQQLMSQQINTQIVAEYARDYYANRPYEVTMQDIEAIALGQQQAEVRQLLQQPEVLLCDTTLLTCKIWAEVAFGCASEKLLSHSASQNYDVTLLLAPDIAWEPDPLRSHPTQRHWLFELYEQELQRQALSYQVIVGTGTIRWQSAYQAILANLN